MHSKGQTAMEYLLILVVVLGVVVALMMYVQSSSSGRQESATCNLNKFLCSQEICGNDTDCRITGDTLELCGTYGYCDCMGKCVAMCDSEMTPPDCGVIPTCPNGICDASEDCSSCPADCGACPACTDDCPSSGSKQCASGTEYQTCGDTDGDGCLEWSAPTICPGSSTCTGAGVCGAACVDDCSSGSKKCASSTENQICGNYDADICLEWSAPTICPGSSTCTGAGVCGVSCTPATCDSLSKQCGGPYDDGCAGTVSCGSCTYGSCVSGACVCTPSFTLTGGGDHCGQDWTISSNTEISGVHTSVGTFKVNGGVTATVKRITSGGTGSVEVQAQNITILGSINADAAGNLGGSGGTGGPGRHKGSEQKNLPCTGSLGSSGGGASGGAGGSGGTYARLNTAEKGNNGNIGGNGVYGSDSNANDNIWTGSGGGGGGGGGGGRGSTCHELGSGGGGGGAGGGGGGTIKLIASNYLTISGVVSSSGSSSAGNGGAGGKGGVPRSLGFSECPTWSSVSGGSGGSPSSSGSRAGGSGGSVAKTGGTGGSGGTGSGGGVLIKGKNVNLASGTINVYGGSNAANQGNIKIRYSCSYAPGTYTGNAYTPIVYATC